MWKDAEKILHPQEVALKGCGHYLIWAAFHMGSDTVSTEVLLVLGQRCNWAWSKNLLASLMKSDCAKTEYWDPQGTKGLRVCGLRGAQECGLLHLLHQNSVTLSLAMGSCIHTIEGNQHPIFINA